jgi:hypothetical protein
MENMVIKVENNCLCCMFYNERFNQCCLFQRVLKPGFVVLRCRECEEARARYRVLMEKEKFFDDLTETKWEI